MTKNYSKACDLWSFGIILFFLMSREFPFQGEDELQLMYNIMERDIVFNASIWDERSDSSKDLIQKLLTKNPDDRITIEEALDHPWFIEAHSVPQLS